MTLTVRSLYEFGEFSLDPQQRSLRRKGELVPLTPKSFDTLLVLLRSGGRVVTKDQLMRTVWPDSFVEESNLTQTIFMLRKALGDSPEQRYILTIQGQGYRFVPDVREMPPPGNATAATSPLLQTSTPPVEPAVDRKTSASRFWLAALALLLIVTAGWLAYHHWSRPRASLPQPPTRIMLAVLPFENLTGDPSQDYLSDGLTEEVITELGRLDSNRLGVIGRTSVMVYKRSPKTLDQVGRELGVQYVLEGSLRREGEKVRIAAQLIRAQDQTHLWAREYDRELKDLFAVQSEVARATADEIQAVLGRPLETPGNVPSPQSYEAYNLYLKGQYFWNKRNVVGFEQAIHYFQQAIATDPNYARAYAGLADVYAMMGGYKGSSQNEFMPKARSAAQRALELDPNLPEAHTALAVVVQNYDHDWETADREFQRAIQLNPNYATGHHWYAEHLSFLGRFDEALRESERARELEPLSLIIAADRGVILYYARRYDEAIAQFRSVMEMDPDFSRTGMILHAYVGRGMFAEMLALRAQRLPQDPANWGPWAWANEGYFCARAGQTQRAQIALKNLLALISANQSILKRWHGSTSASMIKSTLSIGLKKPIRNTRT
jgi:TolB-like protein/DNA-binding winged helix-turn-helix (wHTH) protein/Tfp pilus assembly protein PilF